MPLFFFCSFIFCLFFCFCKASRCAPLKLIRFFVCFFARFRHSFSSCFSSSFVHRLKNTISNNIFIVSVARPGGNFDNLSFLLQNWQIKFTLCHGPAKVLKGNFIFATSIINKLAEVPVCRRLELKRFITANFNINNWLLMSLCRRCNGWEIGVRSIHFLTNTVRKGMDAPLLIPSRCEIVRQTGPYWLATCLG